MLRQSLQGSEFPQQVEGRPFSSSPTASTSSRLSPLSRHKYYDSPGKQLLFDFISDFLAVFVIGFQTGHGSVSDQILFNDDNKTLCVLVSVMLLGQEEARSLVKAKIIEKRRTFLLAPISFEEARLEGIAWG